MLTVMVLSNTQCLDVAEQPSAKCQRILTKVYSIAVVEQPGEYIHVPILSITTNTSLLHLHQYTPSTVDPVASVLLVHTILLSVLSFLSSLSFHFRVTTTHLMAVQIAHTDWSNA
eukprot:GHVN01032374.1.p2 GENE.GHVN01032374.1~~GHVN01032374.1.p2  ORF type:complete len:115 (+),score=7.17 GHVN01032374.1:1459-1803(+)